MALSEDRRKNGESIAHWQQEAVSKGVTEEDECSMEEFLE
jgi:hypothetical protein